MIIFNPRHICLQQALKTETFGRNTIISHCNYNYRRNHHRHHHHQVSLMVGDWKEAIQEEGEMARDAVLRRTWHCPDRDIQFKSRSV